MSSGPFFRQLSSLPTYQSTSTSRLKSLYSDFLQQKHSNPTSFTSNVEWWRRTLEAVVFNGWQSHSTVDSVNVDRLILHATGPTLADEFRFDGIGKPLGLAGVIAELCDSGAYFTVPQFLSGTQSIYDPGWLPYRIASFVIGKPLWWALQQLNIVDSEDAVSGHASHGERWKKVKGDYVVLSLLERAAEGLLRQQQSKTGTSLADSLYKFDSFKREFADSALDGVTLSNLDMKVMLKYLERDKKAVVVQGEVIKFLDTYNASPEITTIDEGVLELKTGVENLQVQVDSIQSQIEVRSEKISAALRRKQKEVALSHLRAQKLLQDLLKKRLGSLEMLHATLLRVEASAGDVEIMKHYESSTATLRAILSHPSLQREKIDETMDAMASAQADATEIADAVQLGAVMTSTDVGIDEAELEAELQAMVKESEAEREKEEKRETDELERQKQARLASGGLRVPTHLVGSRASEEGWTDSEADEDFQKVRTEVLKSA